MQRLQRSCALGCLIVVLLATSLRTALGINSSTDKCGQLVLAGAPDDTGIQEFAKRCPDKCPYASKLEKDICRARCVSTCGPDAPWVDTDNKVCIDCVPGCTECGDPNRCVPGGCREDLSFKFREGECVLPIEGIVKGFLKWLSGGLITVVLILLCCFGGVSHLLLDTLADATNFNYSQVPLLDEWDDESQISEEEDDSDPARILLTNDLPSAAQDLQITDRKIQQQHSHLQDCKNGPEPAMEAEPSNHMAVAGKPVPRLVALETLHHDDRQQQTLLEERNGKAITNWDAMLHGLKAARKSSIRASRARRQLRRYSEFGHRRKVLREKALLPRWMWVQSESVAGIGFLLFRNTQKFYCGICLSLFLSMICLRMYEESNLAEIVRLCSKEGWQAKGQVPVADIEVMIERFQQYCCMEKPISAATGYATAMLWWGGTMWVVIASLTIAFCKFQMNAVETDEGFQQAKGVDEQDYTLFLTNVPTDITSEALFMSELMKKFAGGEDKIYGVSIVYNVRQHEWCDTIQDMLENLVRYDLATQEAYSERTRELYIRSQSLEEITRQVEQDRQDFIDLLTGRGKFAEARSKHNLGSGEAYVVFKSKVALKMTVPCTSGVHWDIDPNDPYRIIKVNECQWEPSDVMWMDCVPTRSGMRSRLIQASIKMIFILSMLFVLTFFVFYSSILPYQQIGADPIKYSTNFFIMNHLLVFVCGLIPGMPVGLAQGIGYTRMNDMEGLIFFFIMGVFGTWNLTAICVQWGVFALNPLALLTRVSQMDAAQVLREISWSAVVPRLMFPGQMVIGYILNEILTALLPVLMPAAISLCIFVLGVFPDIIRMKVAKLMLQLDNWETIDARKFENLVQLQPYRLSMEYAFMMWVPMLSMTMLLFLTDLGLWIFGGLVIYSLLMFCCVPACIHTMRDTSFDSTKSFVVFINSWGQFIAFFPVLSVWWSFRLEWGISVRAGIVMSVMTWCVFFFLFKGALLFMGFSNVMAQNPMKTAQNVDEKHWKTVEENDKGFEHVLNAAGYSWWNMNPIYVLKHRYCPNLSGHQILPGHIQCWPKGYLTETFVEIGRDWRFKYGEDFDLVVDERTAELLSTKGIQVARQEELEEVEKDI